MRKKQIYRRDRSELALKYCFKTFT